MKLIDPYYWPLYSKHFFFSYLPLKITVTRFAKKYFCSSARRSVLSTSFLFCPAMAEIAKLLFKNYTVFFILPKIFNVPYAHRYKPTLDYKPFLNTNCTLVKKFKKKNTLDKRNWPSKSGLKIYKLWCIMACNLFWSQKFSP